MLHQRGGLTVALPSGEDYKPLRPEKVRLPLVNVRDVAAGRIPEKAHESGPGAEPPRAALLDAPAPDPVEGIPEHARGNVIADEDEYGYEGDLEYGKKDIKNLSKHVEHGKKSPYVH